MAEIHVLVLSALLWAAQLVVTAAAASRQLGVAYLAGPRDEPRALTGTPARLKRALDNQAEGLVLFTAAVVAVTLLDRTSALTAACAWVYLAARAAYVPAYALGWSPGRTLIWAVGFLATLTMLLAALVG